MSILFVGVAIKDVKLTFVLCKGQDIQEYAKTTSILFQEKGLL
ncbi:hypothetical protein [Myroides oncorhynchi]|nr:hypothetical protein [Myroides oncorhynchi]